MRIVYLGSGEFGLASLDALAGSRHSLQLVVTQPAHMAGRGRKLRRTPVAEWAASHSVPCVETADVNQPQMVARIAAEQPEVIVVIAFGQKIGNEIISLPAKDIINVHASLVPRYRGAAPVNWAIINGETETGVSIIKVTEKIDAGDILAQRRTAIGQDETAGELAERLGRLAAPLLADTLEKIADGTARYTEQDHTQATTARKLKKSDGFIDFAEPAEVLERRIRGLWPWPGASAIYQCCTTGKAERVTIARARVVEPAERTGAAPGTLDKDLNVICGAAGLKLLQLKPAGGAIMGFRDFVNGRRTRPGDRFVKIGD